MTPPGAEGGSEDDPFAEKRPGLRSSKASRRASWPSRRARFLSRRRAGRGALWGERGGGAGHMGGPVHVCRGVPCLGLELMRWPDGAADGCSAAVAFAASPVFGTARSNRLRIATRGGFIMVHLSQAAFWM